LKVNSRKINKLKILLFVHKYLLLIINKKKKYKKLSEIKPNICLILYAGLENKNIEIQNTFSLIKILLTYEMAFIHNWLKKKFSNNIKINFILLLFKKY